MLRLIQRQVDALLRDSLPLNHRQRDVLSHAIRHPNSEYTIKSHRRSHHVGYDTARLDLHQLADLHLLESSKVGRTWYFRVPADLEQRIDQLPAR